MPDTVEDYCECCSEKFDRPLGSDIDRCFRCLLGLLKERKKQLDLFGVVL